MSLTPDERPIEMSVEEETFYNVQCYNCGDKLTDAPYWYDQDSINTVSDARLFAHHEGFRVVHSDVYCPKCIESMDMEDI